MAVDTSDYFRHERQEMVPLVPLSARRILDVGCGEGAFGRALLRRSPALILEGVEPNAEAARVAAEYYAAVHQGFFPDALPTDRVRYDCVVFNDVLEHMTDPAEALRFTSSLLTDNGTIVVSIPNIANTEVVRGLLRGRFDYADSGVLDRTHLRFYTRSSGRALLEAAGFSVIRDYPSWRIHSRDAALRLERLIPPFATLNYRQTLYVANI